MSIPFRPNCPTPSIMIGSVDGVGPGKTGNYPVAPGRSPRNRGIPIRDAPDIGKSIPVRCSDRRFFSRHLHRSLHKVPACLSVLHFRFAPSSPSRISEAMDDSLEQNKLPELKLGKFETPISIPRPLVGHILPPLSCLLFCFITLFALSFQTRSRHRVSCHSSARYLR